MQWLRGKQAVSDSGSTPPPGVRLSPLPGPVEAPGAAAQVAPVGVGAAVDAGVPSGAALVHVLAAAGALVEVEAGGADAFEAAQRVVAGGGATHGPALALVLICRAEVRGRCQVRDLPVFSTFLMSCFCELPHWEIF